MTGFVRVVWQWGVVCGILAWMLAGGGVEAGQQRPATKQKPAASAPAPTQPVARKNAVSRRAPLGLRYPALSPDGKRVAFSFQGDIWVATRPGGQAVRLTAHPAYDFAPRWSPDGSKILFTSKRTGNYDVFVMPANGGDIRRLTFHSAVDIGNDWDPSGRWILFESNRDNRRSLYRVPLRGGEPMRLIGGYWNIAHAGRVSPDGRFLLFTQSTESLHFWWRKGYVGPNHADIMLWDQKDRKARRLTRNQRNDLWPMWAADGKSFYFVSERSGVANLWQGFLDGKAPVPLTRFSKGPVRWPSVARRGYEIVYERDFQLWVTNVQTKQSRPLQIRLHTGQTPLPAALRRHQKVSEFALSPDGKKLALIMEGDVYVTDAANKTVVHRVTKTLWQEAALTWHPNSRELLFISGHGKEHWLMRKTVFGPPASAILKSKTWIAYPRWNPEGTQIAYLSGNQLMLLQPGTKPRSLLTAMFGGWMADSVQWSPDGKFLLYTIYTEGRGDLWALRLEDKATIRLTPTAANDADGHLTRDGKFFFFRSNRHGSDWFTKVGDDDLYVLPLRWQPPRFAIERLEKLFQEKAGKTKKTSKKAKQKPPVRGEQKPPIRGEQVGESQKPPPNVRPPLRPVTPRLPTTKKHKRATTIPTTTSATKPAKAKSKKAKKRKIQVKVNQRDLLERIRQLTQLRGNDRFPTPSPNGKYVMFFSDTLGKFGLWLGKFNAKKVALGKPQPFAPALRFPHGWSHHGLTWTPDSKAVYVMARGSLYRIAVPSGKMKKLRLAAKVWVRPQQEYMQLFHEVWRTMRDFFYDPKMNGADWNDVYKRYVQAVVYLQTEEDWHDLMNEMLGELNASHLGVSSRRTPPPYLTGRLGVTLTPHNGLLRITRIWRHGPLYKAKPELKAGAYLLRINDQSVTTSTNVAALLRDQVGKRVTLTLASQPKAKQTTQVKLLPIPSWPATWLRYRTWARERRALVSQWGQGKIGYLHMRGMGQRDLQRFLRDFPTYIGPKQAAIIDVRFNWGGNIHDRVLQILSRRLYSYWQARGQSRWNQPFFTSKRRPIVLLINERSLSDAEMMANGFKSLRLGTTIGVPTYRWLIFTSSRSLVGGRKMRVPFWGCRSLQGKDLEKVGVTPDIYVRNSFADRLHNRDPQLKKAVQVLLQKLQAK